MTFSVRDFSAELAQSGVLRGNKFTFFCSIPPGLQQYNNPELNSIVQRMEFYGESGNFPGAQLLTHDVLRYGYGPTEKKPFGVAFNDVQLNFRVDANGQIWDFFRAWLALTIPFEMGQQGIGGKIGAASANQAAFTVAYKSDYAVDCTITSFDETGQPVLKTTLQEAYPIMIGDLPHDWSLRGDYVRLPVTFTYITWYASRPFAQSPTSNPITNADTGPVEQTPTTTIGI